MDTATRAFVEETFGVPVCSMYGTTEVGVILADYPGRGGLRRQARRARASRCPGVRVEVQRPDGEPLRAGRDRRDHGLAARRVVPHEGPRLGRRGGLLLPRRPRRRRHHLGGVDDERGGDRGRAPQAPGRPRGGGDRRGRRPARPGRQGLHREPAAGRRRVRPRAAGVHADAPQPARVPAPCRLRARPSQDARGQDQPQGAARFRDQRARWSPRMPPDRTTAPTTGRLDVPEDHRPGPRRPPPPHRRRDHRHARALVPRGHARRHPPLRARHRRRQSALVRSGVRGGHALGRRHRAAQLSLRDEPHHLRLCRRAARRARHVGRRGLDLASARAAQRRDHDRGVAQGPDRAPDGVRGPRDPADLSRRLLQPARRAGRGRGQLVLPHRPRPGARARHQVHGREGQAAQALHGRGAGRGVPALRARGGPRRRPALLGRRARRATGCPRWRRAR